MKLMGTAKLEELATCGAEGVAGAVAALHAELSGMRWQSETEFLASFPYAHCANGVSRIPLGSAHYVELITNFRTGMALIVNAGAIAKGNKANKTGSKAA